MSNKRTTGELSETTHHLCKWKIPKFNALTYGSYESQSFSFMNMSLHLQVDIPGYFDDYIRVYLINGNKYPCDGTVSFRIEKYDGKLIESKTVTIKKNITKIKFEFLKTSALRNGELKLWPEDILTIFCDLKCDLDEKQTSLHAAEVNTLNDVLESMTLTETDLLSKNFKDLLSNKDSCDVVLLVQGKEFKVHKSILMARSSVFAAMFQHDTAEKQSGTVVIPDCDPNSFQEFLEYLYCGKLEDISSNSALHLYYTSDKYNLPELKTFCTNYLVHSLTVLNVCNVVSLADKYDETSLLSAAQDFFNKNLKFILKTTEWEGLFKKNFRLANKLLIEMSEAKK